MSSNMTDCIESDAFEDQGACYPSAALEWVFLCVSFLACT
jgi:hypothetical protein